MLVQLGRRKPNETLVDLLLECHERIRSFTALALAIAERLDLSAEECREACEQCRRYFTEALPLHVADEEQSLVPRLCAADPELDQALKAMTEEHADHVALLAQLRLSLERVSAAPDDRAHRQALAQIAARVASDFAQHLADEETRIFPRIDALLSAAEQETVRTELRARRQPRSGG